MANAVFTQFFFKGDLLWFSVILWLLIRVANNEISLCASNPYTLKGQASIGPPLDLYVSENG